MAKVDPLTLHRARELRQPQTAAEERLWYWLRDSQLEGLKFRRHTLRVQDTPSAPSSSISTAPRSAL